MGKSPLQGAIFFGNMLLGLNDEGKLSKEGGTMSYNKLEHQQAIKIFGIFHEVEKNLPKNLSEKQEAQVYKALGIKSTIDKDGSINFLPDDTSSPLTPLQKVENNLKKFGPLSDSDYGTLESIDVTKEKMPDAQFNKLQSDIKKKVNEIIDADDGAWMGLSDIGSKMDRKRNRPEEVTR